MERNVSDVETTGSLVLEWNWLEPAAGDLTVSANFNGFAGRVTGYLGMEDLRCAWRAIGNLPWSTNEPWEISTGFGLPDRSICYTIRLIGAAVSAKGQLQVGVELFDDVGGHRAAINFPTSYSAATTFAHQLGHAFDTKRGTAELTADVLE
jgi:hypothetical protein